MAAEEGEATKRRRAQRSRRRRSRLAAVQALYRIGLTGDDAEAAIADLTAPSAPRMDRPFFGALVRGAAARRPTVDPAIAGVLAEGWRFERLSETMRALLRVAAFELSSRGDTPAAVVIGEYVDIAAGFFDDAETGFVNGVVDRLARELEPADG